MIFSKTVRQLAATNTSTTGYVDEKKRRRIFAKSFCDSDVFLLPYKLVTGRTENMQPNRNPALVIVVVVRWVRVFPTPGGLPGVI